MQAEPDRGYVSGIREEARAFRQFLLIRHDQKNGDPEQIGDTLKELYGPQPPRLGWGVQQIVQCFARGENHTEYARRRLPGTAAVEKTSGLENGQRRPRARCQIVGDAEEVKLQRVADGVEHQHAENQSAHQTEPFAAKAPDGILRSVAPRVERGMQQSRADQGGHGDEGRQQDPHGHGHIFFQIPREEHPEHGARQSGHQHVRGERVPPQSKNGQHTILFSRRRYR